MGRARARAGLVPVFLGLAFFDGAGLALLGVLFVLLGVALALLGVLLFVLDAFGVPLVSLFVLLPGVLAGVEDVALLLVAFLALLVVSLPFLGVAVKLLFVPFALLGEVFLFGDAFSSSTKSILSSLSWLVLSSGLSLCAFLVLAAGALNLVGLVGLRSGLVRRTLGAVLGAFLGFDTATGASDNAISRASRQRI